jgi:putative ABC transport system permease protein
VIKANLYGASIGYPTSMTNQISESLSKELLVSGISSFLGIFAFLVAGAGVHGLMAYVVDRAKRQLAIRMALGASPASLFWAVIARSCGLATIGLSFGVPLALVVTQVLRSLLFRVDPGDVATFAVTGFILMAGTIAAVAWPAFIAATTDPVRSLRAE